MSVIGSNILAGASGQGGYFLTNSLRFRSSASAYLNRTPASATNRQTWTWSGWVKRGTLGSWQIFFGAWDGTGGNDTTRLDLSFEAANTISITGGVTVFRNSTQVFRDPSAWYHIVVVADTTNATAQNRLRIYVNGIEITSWGTNNTVTQNTTLAVNNNASHVIGARGNSPTQYFDGYLAEVNLIDGQALTPSSFGETSATTGVWIPKKYTGTYGTNGFYLPFTNTSSTSTLGNDFSGNSNTWTVNNISLTAGSTYDSMTDVPTLTSATAGNYAVMNPLDNGGVTLSNGNLTITGAGSVFKIARSTLGLSTGKWYCEFVITAEGAPSRIDFGLLGFPATLSGSLGDTSNGYTVYESSSSIYKYNNSTSTLLVSSGSLDVNDVQMLAYDADAGKLWFGKNGTWFASGDPVAGTNAAFTGVSGQTYFVAVQAYNTSDVGQINFGQRPFSYTPPSGFVALNTFNLPTPTIGATASTTANKYMNVVTYTGTGSSLSVTGVGFQPDWTWIKERNAAADNGLYDAVRGVQKQLESNTTTAETTETTGLTAFGSDGFTVGALAQLNTSADTYVAWNWKANGAGVTNTAGSITSTVSANTTSGFSIVTWAGNSTNAATIGHGLGVAPSILITKSRTNASSWVFGIGGMSGFGINDYLVLQSTAAKGTSSTFYQAYGSSTFTVGVSAADEMNKTGNNYVTYCFAPIAGYSAFGSYTGNGSADGPFIYTGFRPKFFMTKITSAAGYDWIITDTSRDTYNVSGLCLEANLNNAESTNGGAFSSQSDILSNGFKIRNSGTGANGSGGTYIYMAFAETPQKFALGR